jgi:hypothetical protein
LNPQANKELKKQQKKNKKNQKKAPVVSDEPYDFATDFYSQTAATDQDGDIDLADI